MAPAGEISIALLKAIREENEDILISISREMGLLPDSEIKEIWRKVNLLLTEAERERYKEFLAQSLASN